MKVNPREISQNELIYETVVTFAQKWTSLDIYVLLRAVNGSHHQ